MNAKHLVLAAFVVTVGVITWHEINTCCRLPFPSRIVMAGVTFGVIDLITLANSELGGVLGIGVAIAAIVNDGFVHGCNVPNCQPTKPPHCGGSVIAA
jgi:hypothetical protein